MAEDVIERALEGVADGASLDWDVLESGAANEDELECLQWLRVIDQIGNVVRTCAAGTADSAPVPSSAAVATGPAVEAPAANWGRYELREMVGEGTFGSVYRAWDPQLDREVAIKILHQKASDGRLKKNLLAEGRALARIRHANVVRVLGVESHGDRVGLCMDFIRGQTLDDVVRVQGTLNALEAVLVGRDVCEALAAVHRADFVHRDVKARNVIREQGGRFVLMDFGAGRDISQERARLGDITGTPLYMAPEVLAGGPASPCSDVYSVGVLLYYLVTGDYPVQARTVDELRAAHWYGERRFLTEVRPELAAPFVRAVERALATDPQERYANAAAFLDELRTVLRQEPSKHESIAEKLVLVFYAIYGAVAVAAVSGGLGILTSTMFNHALGLSNYAADSLRDWVIWGAKSTLLPVFIVTVALVVASHVVMLQRLVAARSARGARFFAAVRGKRDQWARRYGLNDVATLSSLVLLVSTSSVALALWYFYPLIRACFEPIATAAPSGLALLSPSLADTLHTYFRGVFTLVILFAVVAWWMVLKLASRHGQRVSRSMRLGGAGATILAVAILSLPYRILRHNEFEAVKWQEQSCYIIGERAADLLLFCPEAQTPRSHIVPRSDPSIERLGQRENIFTRVSPAPRQ
jgi:hypothetical protein